MADVVRRVSNVKLTQLTHKSPNSTVAAAAAAEEDHHLYYIIIVPCAFIKYYYFSLTTLRNMKVVAEKRTILSVSAE